MCRKFTHPQSFNMPKVFRIQLHAERESLMKGMVRDQPAQAFPSCIRPFLLRILTHRNIMCMMKLQIACAEHRIISVQSTFAISFVSVFQSVNKVLAKKLIDDKTRDYMNARRTAKVSKNLLRSCILCFYLECYRESCMVLRRVYCFFHQ